MEFIDPLDLVHYLKFGYNGDTLDLIYFVLIIKLIIWPIIAQIYKFIVRRVK